MLRASHSPLIPNPSWPARLALDGGRAVHNVTSLGCSRESQAVTTCVLVPPENVGLARKVHRVVLVGFTIIYEYLQLP